MKSRPLLWKKNKHGILSVSKPVAIYPKYVHVKACLARRCTDIAWGLVKMTFIPAPGKAKGYHPISLLSFVGKS